MARKKIIKKELQFQTLPSESESSGGGIATLQKEVSPIEIKVGQLEVKLETLGERLKNEQNLKLWIIGTVLAIVAGIFTAFTIYINLVRDSQESYRNLQKDYYQALIDLRNDLFEKSSGCVPVADIKENKK